MNELSSLGLILLFALAAGHLVKFLRIPEVTGYILAGVAVGPSGLGWVSHENLAALEVFSEVALGLILFSIGSIFEIRRVRRAGPAMLRVTGAESTLAGLLVAVAMFVLNAIVVKAGGTDGVAVLTSAWKRTMSRASREMKTSGLSQRPNGITPLTACSTAFRSVKRST